VLVRAGRDLAARHLGDLTGDVQILPPKGTVQLGAHDVFVHSYGGGGGLGDPLERPPAEVGRDVASGLVTAGAAASEYFVVLDADGTVDGPATVTRRAAERRRRLDGADPAPHTEAHGTRLSRHIVLREGRCHCRHCGREWGALGPGYKEGLLLEEIRVTDRWPAVAALAGAGRFVIRRLRCPGCATQVETEVNRSGAPLVTTFDH